MSVIKHKDREIYYEQHDLIPHIKIFHQDYSPFGPGSDYAVQAVSAGKARADMERLGDDHIKTYFALKPFLEEPPTLIPSYDYIIYDGKERKFPFMDIIDAGILAPNQLIISYRPMGMLQKYRMAPHITAPVVIKHRDSFIDDYYIMIYFWHHGCDLVDWENTIFGWVDNMIFQNIISTFTCSLNDYKFLRQNPPKKTYKPFSISFANKYDIFSTCITLKPFASKTLTDEIMKNEFKNVWISGGSDFETILKDKIHI